MIPIIIGAAAAGAAAYKFLNKEHEKIHETTWTRIIPESEVPPDIVEKIRRKQLARLAAELDNKKL